MAMQDDNVLEFYPHYYILNGKSIGCYKHAQQNETCYPHCTNNGRYCSWGARGITGEQVITESLRRKCLWKHYPGAPFWKYIDQFTHRCFATASYFANADCLQDAYKHAGVQVDQMDECMKDSGGLTDDNENSMLQDDLEWSDVVVQTPTLWVNWVPYSWGPLEPRWVLETICHGYVYGQAPHICHVCAMCGDPTACAARSPMSCNPNDGKEPEPSYDGNNNKKKHHGHWFLHFFFFVLLVGAIVAGYIYYRNNHMEEGVGQGMGYQSLGMALMSDRNADGV